VINDLLSLFRQPSPEVLAAKELDEARRELLAAQSAAEYADAMCVYHQARIERLRDILAGVEKGE
jgi:hypothetical protein